MVWARKRTCGHGRLRILSTRQGFSAGTRGGIAGHSRYDDELAEAHDAKGHLLVQYQQRSATGEECYRGQFSYAIMSANTGNDWRSYEPYQGRVAQAVADMQHAQKLEPTRMSFNANIAMMLYFEREYTAAISLLNRCSCFGFAVRPCARAVVQMPASSQATSRARCGTSSCARGPLRAVMLISDERMPSRVESSKARREVERLQQRGREGFGVRLQPCGQSMLRSETTRRPAMPLEWLCEIAHKASDSCKSIPPWMGFETRPHLPVLRSSSTTLNGRAEPRRPAPPPVMDFMAGAP